MWECKRCHFKNNNSSHNCHGPSCKAVVKKDAIELPQVLLKPEEEKVWDYCKVCLKDQWFSRFRHKTKLRWRCHGCHRMFLKHGKSNAKTPKPQDIVTELDLI